MRYATGLDIPDPFIYAELSEKKYVIVSSLELSRAKKEAKRGIKVIFVEDVDTSNIRIPKTRKQNLADLASSFLLSYNVTEVQVPHNTWTLHTDTFREHNLRVKLANPFFPERLIKTEDELRSIKATGKVVKDAFKVACNMLRESKVEWDDKLVWNDAPLTSERLKSEIEAVFMQNGCASGDSIVACGEQSAEPHNQGSGPLHAGQPIIIDLFPRDKKTGYYFDFTRTVVKGTPDPELKKLYDTVKRAQAEALAVVAPGNVKHVHLAAAEVFVRAGYETTDEEGFIHSTGHGLGVELHEPPRISERSGDELLPGMVITIEPGLYYKGIGGVRIEDTVVVTEDGHINLTNVPKNLTL